MDKVMLSQQYAMQMQEHVLLFSYHINIICLLFIHQQIKSGVVQKYCTCKNLRENEFSLHRLKTQRALLSPRFSLHGRAYIIKSSSKNILDVKIFRISNITFDFDNSGIKFQKKITIKKKIIFRCKRLLPSKKSRRLNF